MNISAANDRVFGDAPEPPRVECPPLPTVQREPWMPDETWPFEVTEIEAKHPRRGNHFVWAYYKLTAVTPHIYGAEFTATLTRTSSNSRTFWGPKTLQVNRAELERIIKRECYEMQCR